MSGEGGAEYAPYPWEDDATLAAKNIHLEAGYAAGHQWWKTAGKVGAAYAAAALKPRVAFTPQQAMEQYIDFWKDTGDATIYGLEEWQEYMEQVQHLPDAMRAIKEAEVGSTPARVIYEDGIEVLEYEPVRADGPETPLLAVYAHINRPYVMDLGEGRSVVDQFRQDGFDTHLLKWNAPRGRDTTLADHLADIDAAVDVVREETGAETVNLLGYCQGGAEAAMYAARHPEKVENLGLMAAGLHFDGTGGELEELVEGFNPEMMVGPTGYVPWQSLAIGFAGMDAVREFYMDGKWEQLFGDLSDEEALEQFAQMEHWNMDGVDVEPHQYKQFVENMYQQNQLSENELVLDDGERVDIDNIDMSVLQVVGEYDHLIPPAASTMFNDRIPSEDTEVMSVKKGHIGLATSETAHRELWPAVVDWYAERS